MPLKKVYSAKIGFKKMLKGNVGGVVVFAFLAAIFGRGVVDWEMVNEFRELVFAAMVLLYGAFEGVWNLIKFFAGDKIKEEVDTIKKTVYHFTHKDD